jgi:hypothetical protein
MDVNAETLNQFFQVLTVLILALIAWWNKQRTDSAATTAAATTQTAASNAAIASTEKAAVAQIASTQQPQSMIPQPAGYPVPLYSTSYRMRDVTREDLFKTITDPNDRQSVDAQIAAAEKANLSDYTVTWSHGRWARIQYGAWMATSGQVTFISQIIGGAFDDSQGIPLKV